MLALGLRTPEAIVDSAGWPSASRSPAATGICHLELRDEICMYRCIPLVLLTVLLSLSLTVSRRYLLGIFPHADPASD